MTRTRKHVDETTLGAAAAYVPRDLQLAIREQTLKTRMTVAVIHRRGGKTVEAINWLLEGCSENPDQFGFFVSPFKSQSKNNCFSYLKEYGRAYDAKVYKTDLRAVLPNGSEIALLGASKGWVEVHRGLAAHRLVFDEVDGIPRPAWTSVFRPMLADTEGPALFIGTPGGGYGHFYEHYQKGLDPNLPHWGSIKRTVYETGIIADSEIEQLKLEMPADDFAREFECDFDVPPPGAFYGEPLSKATIEPVQYDPRHPVFTSWYLDSTDQGTVMFWQVIDGQRRLFDCRQALTTTSTDLARAVLERHAYRYERHYAAPSSLTHDTRGRYAAIRRAGINLKPARALPVMDSIFATKEALPDLVINESLEDLLISLRMYAAEYDADSKTFSSKPVSDWHELYCSALSAFITEHRTHTDWSKPLPLAGDKGFENAA